MLFKKLNQIRNIKLFSTLVVLLCSILLTSCSSDSNEAAGTKGIGNTGTGTGTGKGNTGGTSGVDSFITGTLVRIEDAVKYNDETLVALLDKVRGSVGKFRSGSKVIWSRKNDAGLGLYISANHVYGIDSWPAYDEGYIDLTTESNGIFLSSHIVNKKGEFDLTQEYIADFSLYHPYIPPNTTNTNILPANDFYLGVVDNQRLINANYGIASYPDFIQTTAPLEMYDPLNRAISDKTWSEAIDGEKIIAVGYPQDTANYPYGAVSIGNVFTDLQADEAIELLFQNGDEEGGIPYNAEVEFIVDAKSVVGMSGGGVFNAKGQLLGVMVRGTVLNEQPILRVVRVKYIKDTFKLFFNGLFQDEQDYLRGFVGLELD
jgi:hypothetical protein